MSSSTPPSPSRPRHPIAVVAERTGLSQDVLRVWERRYGAVKPQRGPDGKRLYTDADIERLGLMHAATRAGRAVSRIASMSTAAIAALVAEDAEARQQRAPLHARVVNAESTVDDALALIRSLDAARLGERLRRAESQMGVSHFLESVAAPLLRRVGDEWHAGRITPAQEHLGSSVLYDLAMQTMRAFPASRGAGRVLVATPAGDRHVIGAALIGAVAAVQGWDVVYVGADLPASEIASAAIAAQVRLVALSVVYVDDPQRVLGEVRAVRALLPRDIAMIAGGAGAASMAQDLTASGIRVEGSLAGWTDELQRQSAA